MKTVKEYAIKKMETELLEEHAEIEQALFDWLVQQEDEALFNGILEEQKSLANARKYAYSQAFKNQVGGCAMVKDEDVYVWTAEYYKTPIIVATKGELTKEKKAEKPKKAPQKCENTVKNVVDFQPKTTTDNMMKGEQLDLLDFL
ncbi:Cas9 inhibitor AcrIIA9 family protein [Enterococcus sp. 5H]|uniref:Cas9 inhibitor AcrIIA9 family protein n=1 Tax=Enterococcus sp. 5H TaxID=1229490 RepID=UPI0023038FE0|nr:Cas9 inhibitor AcrIIA9 family protein [Enterococcus sp. 5H]MDA9469878.1 hypothetical protein [Enterococcus sp. 5H]